MDATTTLGFDLLSEQRRRVTYFADAIDEARDGGLSAREACRQLLEGKLVSLNGPNASPHRKARVANRAGYLAANSEKLVDEFMLRSTQYEKARDDAQARLAAGESVDEVARDMTADALDSAMALLDDTQSYEFLSALRSLQALSARRARAALNGKGVLDGDVEDIASTLMPEPFAAGDDVADRIAMMRSAVLADDSVEYMVLADEARLLAELLHDGATADEALEEVREVIAESDERAVLSCAFYVELEIEYGSRDMPMNAGLVAVAANALVDEARVAEELDPRRKDIRTFQQREQELAASYEQAADERLAAIAAAVKRVSAIVVGASILLGEIALCIFVAVTLCGVDTFVIAAGAIMGIMFAGATVEEEDFLSDVMDDASDAIAEAFTRTVLFARRLVARVRTWAASLEDGDGTRQTMLSESITV